MSEPETFAARLSGVVARHLGHPGEIINLTRLTGGATKETWSFDARAGSERLPLILQVCSAPGATGGQAAGPMPQIGGDQDAALMIVAVRHGVPAPRVRLILKPDDGLGVGFVTDRVEGETLGGRIVRDARFAAARRVMAGQCGAILAAIHAIDPRGLDFLEAQTAAEQVEASRAVVDHYDHRLPAIELALRWAEEHLPRNPRATLVHGDFRTGNLIVGEEGVRCVLDWEGAQIADPMLDLGWLCVKTWRFGGKPPVGGFGRREELFAAYEKAGGQPVDPDHVRFWEIFGCVRWAVICMRKSLRYLDGVRLTVEAAAIGRRIEEPIWDLLNLIDERG